MDGLVSLSNPDLERKITTTLKNLSREQLICAAVVINQFAQGNGHKHLDSKNRPKMYRSGSEEWLVSHPNELVTAYSGRVEMRFNIPKHMEAMCCLYRGHDYTTTEQEIDRATFVSQEGSKVRVIIAFPWKGNYNAKLYVREKDSVTTFSAAFGYKLTAPQADVFGLPHFFDISKVGQTELLAPIRGLLYTHENVHFKIRSVAPLVKLVVDDEWIDFEKDPYERNVWILTKMFRKKCDANVILKQPYGTNYSTFIIFKVQ